MYAQVANKQTRNIDKSIDAKCKYRTIPDRKRSRLAALFVLQATAAHAAMNSSPEMSFFAMTEPMTPR